MIEYILEPSLDKAVERLVTNEQFAEFSEIRNHEIQFLVAQKVKTDKAGVTQPTSGAAVTLRRISPADAVFLEGFHYKLYVCAHRWEQASELQREAMLHAALKRVNVELKKNGLKLSLRHPDVEMFYDTVRHFGCWEQSLIVLRENLAAALEVKTKLERSEPGTRKK